MKKILTVILSVCMLMTLAACGSSGTGSWMSGKRFSGSESQDDVMNWVNSL